MARGCRVAPREKIILVLSHPLVQRGTSKLIFLFSAVSVSMLHIRRHSDDDGTRVNFYTLSLKKCYKKLIRACE